MEDWQKGVTEGYLEQHYNIFFYRTGSRSMEDSQNLLLKVIPNSMMASFFFSFKELDLVLQRIDKKVLLKVISNSTTASFSKVLDHV